MPKQLGILLGDCAIPYQYHNGKTADCKAKGADEKRWRKTVARWWDSLHTKLWIDH